VPGPIRAGGSALMPGTYTVANNAVRSFGGAG
jgi:hypothetical protein